MKNVCNRYTEFNLSHYVIINKYLSMYNDYLNIYI